MEIEIKPTPFWCFSEGSKIGDKNVVKLSSLNLFINNSVPSYTAVTYYCNI